MHYVVILITVYVVTTGLMDWKLSLVISHFTPSLFLPLQFALDYRMIPGFRCSHIP